MTGPAKPYTVLTIEQKNILADETNPTIDGGGDEGPKPKPIVMSPRSPHRKPYVPKAKSVITVLRSRMQDDRRLHNVCLPILVVWLVLASFLTGVLFYKHFARRPTYFGWCGTSFVEEGRRQHLSERLEIDQEELYERIQVPKFGANRPAAFIHDFSKNMTAIVDGMGKRCFFRPLDTEAVPAPKTFIELIEKLKQGYLEQNHVVHETYRVQRRMNMDDLLAIGSRIITSQCAAFEMFWLEPASRSRSIEVSSSPYAVRNKRGAPAPQESLQFSVMNGENVEVSKIVF